MYKLVVSIFIVFFECKSVVTAKPKVECGYKQCPQMRDGALNVHIIPHSHMDAGWVKTFDEYYYGTRTSVSTANVQLIYHSVLSELLHDKRRKFTFSEVSYFWRWWKEQRPATRATFRTLVQEGRVEFAGGGWVQNDEATVDYAQIIDHYTWGLRKLNDTLGPCGKPKAAWQIDTYGHTREQTSLLAQMGYDGLFIGRVDHNTRRSMIDEDRMEFMWRGSDVLGKMTDIMTHTLFNLYNAPEGFCFDFLCSDEPIVDDPDNKAYNAERRVSEFIAQIEKQAKYYDHDNILVTLGGDFTYQSAANWFMNVDKLISHISSHPANLSDINIFYSTPSCYLKAIYLFGRRDKAIATDRGDHIPYGSDAQTYWTGFYSSRPTLKYLIRKAHTYLQVVKQLTVLGRSGDFYELHLLRHAVNLVVHHDAITGTSQQHVTNDFIRIVTEAMDACAKKVSALLGSLTPTWGGSRRSKNGNQFIMCHDLNISQCRFTETQDTILLLVYNPSSVKTYHHVRLPAVALHYDVRDYNDEEVEYQLVPLPAAVINLPGRTSTAIQELCFEAENIPPLGFAAYYISPVREQMEESEFKKKQAKNSVVDQEVVTTISNEYLKVTINETTGLLESIQHVDGIRISLSQNFFYYSQSQQSQQSGAYSFRPESNRPKPVSEKATYTTVRGPLVKEIRQRFNDWITQVVRLNRGEEYLEMEWIVGPVPLGNDLGKEVVSLFTSDISNHGFFHTDSNGRQMMKRSCFNETTSQKLPVSACYYPVTSRMCIHSLNNSAAMCVLNDRAQGGTSYNEGELELMVHRRLLTDDGFGLEEALNEEAYGVGLVVKGKHRIVFGDYRQDVEELTFSERAAAAARRWRLEPWLFMTTGDKVNRRKWTTIRTKRFSVIRAHGLPRNVHVLTLEPWKGGSVLLRLENTLEKPLRGPFKGEKSEGPEAYVNKPSHISVQLKQVFAQRRIRMVRETTLAANQWLDDARQMDWSTRYVYNGADDEILPDDVIESREASKGPKDDSKAEGTLSDENREEEDYTQRKTQLRTRHANNGQYSDEDTEYMPRNVARNKSLQRYKQWNKNKSKLRQRSSRQKRNLDLEENLIYNMRDEIEDLDIKMANDMVESTGSEFTTKAADEERTVLDRNEVTTEDATDDIEGEANGTTIDSDTRTDESTIQIDLNVTAIDSFNTTVTDEVTKLNTDTTVATVITTNVASFSTTDKIEETTTFMSEASAYDIEVQRKTKEKTDTICTTRKSRYWKSTTPSIFTTERGKNSDEATNVSSEVRARLYPMKRKSQKINRRNKNRKGSGIIVESEDVTKSIYEMYYRSNYRSKGRYFPVSRPGYTRKLVLERIKQPDDVQCKDKSKRTYSSEESSPEVQPGQTRRLVFTSRRTNTTPKKSRYEDSAEDVEVRRTSDAKGNDELSEYDFWRDLEIEDKDKEVIDTAIRRKRATDELASDTEQAETFPDYTITLRPTQIRSFVIWFENKPKKPY